jgi:hypothetical protein
MAIKMAAEKINLQANLSSIKRKFRIFTSCSLKLMIKSQLFLHSKNSSERLIGYTFHVGSTYRANCITPYCVPFFMCCP